MPERTRVDSRSDLEKRERSTHAFILTRGRGSSIEVFALQIRGDRGVKAGIAAGGAVMRFECGNEAEDG